MLLAILLGSVILLVLYYLYLSLFSTPLISTISLRNTNPDIPSTSISRPTSIRYAFGVWIYVKQFSTDAVLFNYNDSAGSLFNLQFQASTPTLIANIKGTGGMNTVVVSNNFPLQRWTYVLVNVDNDFTDVFLDGKLVRSTKLKNIIKTEPQGEPKIVFGKNSDIDLAKLMRWSSPLDPQSVWNEFIQGSGDTRSKLFGDKYHFDLTVTNNEYQKDYKIF